jgi:alpha-ketoglutarate-dependent taurine dioxygenase
MAIDITPCSPALGAEIRGVDLSQPLDDGTIRSLKDAWFEHHVLLFRDQDLTDSDLVRFSNYFGSCDKAPPNEAANKLSEGYSPDVPEVAIISNVVVDGVEIGSLGSSECAWHTDMSYNPEPADASVLYALEVPEAGGDTAFLNMYKAHDALPDGLKERIGGRKAIHDATFTSAGGLRKGLTPPTDVSKAPGAHHPILRTHPVTGKTMLFLGRRTNAYIVGMDVAESEALLDEIWDHTTNDDFVWTHQWRKGDVLLWDNRSVMHRRDDFDPSVRRLMHRTQLKGEVPFYTG